MKKYKGLNYEVIGLEEESDLKNIKEALKIIKNSQFDEEVGKIEYVVMRRVDEYNVLVDIIWRNYVICFCDRLEISTFDLIDILEEREAFIECGIL